MHFNILYRYYKISFILFIIMLSNIDTETYRLLNVEHLRQTEDIQDRTKGIRGVKRRKERGRKKSIFTAEMGLSASV